ncbi:lytic transglycosylase domain-containing protein [Lutimonas zeaxanthinifaciens]|uniref:lytic transglycosylase domain-containing protein n=1 Tax=Lutimonas zeaxanthinifaciens TaxID=3060215 RepID=UPI00265CCAD9|nr:lytic transglycosylase domain-containing protein [Lutimonas sp. YSD2104]WKK65526.1 transglycosylase SLT domain-containing protein [Lutimonas sp. YSD2104]
MKKILLFSFILLSLFLTGQNNVPEKLGELNNDSGFKTNPNFWMELSNLRPSDIVSNTMKPDLFLVNQSKIIQTEENDAFSSMLLKEQLSVLNKTTPFRVYHNATLERFIRVYLKDRREYLNRLIGKSAYYFPVIEQHLDRFDLPIELKYLAVVESALNPVAVSASGAKGLWQFMYGTGNEYGLRIDSFVDERFDLIKSTRAACSYLESLYKTFGDWDLALAAYNSGPGNVKKAIRRAGGSKNYWELRKFLPKETSSYVPAFYATMYLFTHADFHGLKPESKETEYRQTDTIQIKGSLNFDVIQKYAGVPMKTLRSFNPSYKKDIIPDIPGYKMYLTLPLNYLQQFLEAENEIYLANSGIHVDPKPREAIAVTKMNSYIVKPGDNLNSIAVKHNISLEKLKTWNGLESNFLISGQRLVVTDKTGLAELPTLNKNKIPDTKYQIYKVGFGDTLFKISRKFGNIPISELRTLNGLENVNYLKPGTELKIKTRDTGSEIDHGNKS